MRGNKIPQGEGLAGREVCGRNVLFFNPVFNRNSFYSIEMLCIIRYHNHIIDNWRASNYQIKIHDTQTTLSESESFFCIKWNSVRKGNNVDLWKEIFKHLSVFFVSSTAMVAILKFCHGHIWYVYLMRWQVYYMVIHFSIVPNEENYDVSIQ